MFGRVTGVYVALCRSAKAEGKAFALPFGILALPSAVSVLNVSIPVLSASQANQYVHPHTAMALD